MYVGALVFAVADAALPSGETGNFIRDYQDLIGSSIGAATVLLLVVQMQKDRARHEGIVGVTLRPEQKALAGALRYAQTVLAYDLEKDMPRIKAIVSFATIPVFQPMSAKVLNDLSEHAQDHILQLAEKLATDANGINLVMRASAMAWESRVIGANLALSYAKTSARNLLKAIGEENAFMDIYVKE